MATARVSTTVNMPGIQFAATFERSAEGVLIQDFSGDLTLAAAKQGVITTSVVTLSGGHGITNSDVVDVFWTESGVKKIRRGCSCSVATNDVTLSSGSGDTLPTGGATVYLGIQQEVSLTIAGDQLSALGVYASERCSVDFHDSGGSELALDIADGEGFAWVSDSGVTNPIAGDSITHVVVSCGSIDGATLQIAALVDNA